MYYFSFKTNQGKHVPDYFKHVFKMPCTTRQEGIQVAYVVHRPGGLNMTPPLPPLKKKKENVAWRVTEAILDKTTIYFYNKVFEI